jgi:aspartate kinase
MKTHAPLMVKKFGGTSVGTTQRIEAVAERVLQDSKKGGYHPVLVASAMAGETNRLVQLAHDIDPYYRGPAYDMLLASGEQAAISLLAVALEKRGAKALPLLAHQIGIYTDSVYSKARITGINTKNLMQVIDDGYIPVVAGFQGVNEFSHITTLGRGGSDTTAVALAAALKASVCEIYTDVPAVFSADPRLVPRARELHRIHFEEMMEMASLGSKVLHLRSVELAYKYGVQIHLRSTFESREGTWIVPEEDSMEQPVVSAVTHEGSTTVFKLYPVPFGSGFLSDLFSALAEKNILVDIITQSQSEGGQRIAFSVNQEDVHATEALLKRFLTAQVKVESMSGMAKISVVGVGMKNHPGVAARFFAVLKRLEIPVHLVTTSEIKISAVVESAQLEAAAQGLHSAFDLDRIEDHGV